MAPPVLEGVPSTIRTSGERLVLVYDTKIGPIPSRAEAMHLFLWSGYNSLRIQNTKRKKMKEKAKRKKKKRKKNTENRKKKPPIFAVHGVLFYEYVLSTRLIHGSDFRAHNIYGDTAMFNLDSTEYSGPTL